MNLLEMYRSMPARYPELRGQVAVVTGSSHGIGAGIAARLLREGMRVVISGHVEADVETVTAQFRGEGADVFPVFGDLRHPQGVDDLFDRTLSHYGTVNLLVNNAADLRRTKSEELTRDFIDYQLDLNMKSPFLCSLRAADAMRSLKSGNIVNITSVGGLRAHLPGLPYDITKTALDGLTRAMAIDLADLNIRVNGVAPGWTPHEADLVKHAERLNKQAEFIPLRKAGRPDDIGAAVAFLASDDASYITGQILYVDGGMTAQLHPPRIPM